MSSSSKKTARELSLGGAIEALKNGQAIYGALKSTSSAYGKVESAYEVFREQVGKLAAELKDAGYSAEMLSPLSPKEGSTLQEKALFSFLNHAIVETRMTKREADLYRVEKPKGDATVKVGGKRFNCDGKVGDDGKKRPSTEAGRQRALKQSMPKRRERLVGAIKRAMRELDDSAPSGRTPNRSGQWIIVRQERLEAEIAQLKKATAEQLDGTDAIACQMFLERALDCLKGKLPKSVIAKYRAVK